MINKCFKSATNLQLSDGAKCFLVACAVLSTLLITMIFSVIPFLAFVACVYLGWEISWKLIVALIVSWREQS